MKITITIDTDNAAFADAGPENEATRILLEALPRLRDAWDDQEFAFSLRDANGNRVGKVEVTE